MYLRTRCPNTSYIDKGFNSFQLNILIHTITAERLYKQTDIHLVFKLLLLLYILQT